MLNQKRALTFVFMTAPLLLTTACGSRGGKKNDAIQKQNSNRDVAAECDYEFDRRAAPYHHFKSWEEVTVSPDYTSSNGDQSKTSTLKLSVVAASKDRYEIKREGESFEIMIHGVHQIFERKKFVDECIENQKSADAIPPSGSDFSDEKVNTVNEPFVVDGRTYNTKKVTRENSNGKSVSFFMPLALPQPHTLYGKAVEDALFTLHRETVSNSKTSTSTIVKLEERASTSL